MEITPEQVGLALFAAGMVALAFIRRWVIPGPELYERLAEKDEIITIVTEDREKMRVEWMREITAHSRANDGLEQGKALVEGRGQKE